MVNWNDSNPWTCCRSFSKSLGTRFLVGENSLAAKQMEGLEWRMASIYTSYISQYSSNQSVPIRFFGHLSLVFVAPKSIRFSHWNEQNYPRNSSNVLILRHTSPPHAKKAWIEFSFAALVFVFGLRLAHTEDAFCRSTYTTFSRAGLRQTRINLTP